MSSFTPIDPALLTIIPAGTPTANSSAVPEAKNGRKRERKISSLDAETNRGSTTKHSKKAIQRSSPNRQGVASMVNVTKPDAAEDTRNPDSNVALNTPRESFGFDDVKQLSAEISFSNTSNLPSVPTLAFNSSYQAAFRDGAHPSGTKRQIRSPETEGSWSRTVSGSDPLDPWLTASTAGHDLQDGIRFTTYGKEANTSKIVDQVLPDSTCQISCSWGIIVEKQNCEARVNAPTVGTSDLGSPSTLRVHEDRPKISCQTNGLANVVSGVTHLEEDHPHCEKTFHPSGKFKTGKSVSSWELSKRQDTHVEELSEGLADQGDLSVASDLDCESSREDGGILNGSSPVSWECSSSYSEAPSSSHHHSNGPDPLSHDTELSDAFDEEFTYDDDLEAMLRNFDSPTSAQVPTVSPSVSPNNLQRSSLPKPLNVPHQVSFDEQTGAPIPFVRPPFPSSVRDRSTVLGLTSNTRLRTCFRIGEALNAASTALRSNQDVVIEVYVRVLHSERPAGSVKQQFRFSDIFVPDKPPYLKGSYGLWKGNRLWDEDSRGFLGDQAKPKMARVVGRMVRDDQGNGMEMRVLSIWEADWEDVGICKGHFFHPQDQTKRGG
ncbi:MAG: hypothetical protein Q9183_002204 [Haloplaca sp. 2 TL-2023]